MVDDGHDGGLPDLRSRRAVVTGSFALAATGVAGPVQPNASPAHGRTPSPRLRSVALEEHFSIASVAGRISDEVKLARGYPPQGPRTPSLNQRLQARLADVGQVRLADMDASGITVQVLSWVGPGADLIEGEDARQFARDVNDGLAAAVAAHPGRYAGFAHLAMGQPDVAADELERCVRDLGFVGALINGTTEGRFLDHPSFEPLLRRAERLDVPLYLHPNLPPGPVFKAYYEGLPAPLDFILSTYGFGWHAEVGIHVLRLIFAGVLERHRGLKLIVGHMGEYLPMAMERTAFYSVEATSRTMSRDVARQLRDQVWVTTSGLFTKPPFQALVDTFGIDRVMFSVDYPFSSNTDGRAFLDSLDLAPTDMEKFCFRNADLLLRLPV